MSNSKHISKSKASIHYMLGPGVKLTTTAVKTMNVFMYFIQSLAKNLPTADAFNRSIGTGNLEVSIPKTLLFNYTVGASSDGKSRSRNYKILNDVIAELKQLEINFDNHQEEGREDRGFMRVFPGIREYNGSVIFTVSSAAREVFVNDNTVAKIDFVRVNEEFSARYGMHLNDLIEERMFTSTENYASLAFTDEEIRNGLHVQYSLNDEGEKVYSNKDNGSLKAKVIQPAIEQYNEACLTFECLNVEFNKEEQMWFIDIQRRKSRLFSLISREFPDEIVRIQTFFSTIKLNKAARVKLEESLISEKEVSYMLYIIEIVEENQARVTKSLSAYFVGCYQQNREKFEADWEAIKAKQLLEKQKKRLETIKTLNEQNQRFREDFIKMTQDNFREAVAVGQISSSEYRDAYSSFLSKSLLIPAFKQEHQQLQESGLVCVDSMPFRSFASQHVQIDENECQRYISNQTKTLKVR